MADEINKHYEEYKAKYGDEGYRMEKMKETSRVLFLKEYISRLVPKGGRILDVGCGDMYLAKELPDYDWVGVDIAPDMSDGRALKQDLMETPYPFPAQSFDAAVCSEVLEHLWDLRVVNLEMKRLLKPGGHYIMSTPNFDHIDYTLSGYREILFDPSFTHQFEHIRQYNFEVHKRFLEEVGFTIIEHTGADAHFSKFFDKPRRVLYSFFNRTLQVPMNVGQIDQLLGTCFPLISHTVMIISKA